MDWKAIESELAMVLGRPFVVRQAEPVGGGCINDCFVLQGADQRLFLKRNRAELLPMFEAEAAALEDIGRTGTLRAPTPLATGTDAHGSWLALELIEFEAPSPATFALLGEGLAALHRCTTADFGWHRDNYIGSSKQANSWTAGWLEFFARQRLTPQLSLAAVNGASPGLIKAGERLLENLPVFFRAYQPVPSLLHGDLWAGNWAADKRGAAVVFDPAAYFGDREADLAMTELFGGFDDRFYQSYRSCWDIDPGYATRKVLYNLYHVLNHFNLFGGSYEHQAQDMIDRLNAEAG